MDWNRTKTIFIVTFLLLNGFLVLQLMEKRSESDVNVRAKSTLQEQVEKMNIVVPELPEETEEGTQVTGQRINIEEELIDIAGEDNVNVMNDNFVEVTMEQPYEITGDTREEQRDSIRSFLDQEVWRGEEYQASRWENNEENSQLYLFQEFNDDPVYTYDEDQLVLMINDDNEIESYIQSYLEFEEQGSTKDLLSHYRAIEYLLNDGILTFNDEISELELAYFSFFSPAGDVQVFQPMYRMEVNESSEYLVNAISGNIQNPEDVLGEGEPEEEEDENEDENEGEGEQENDQDEDQESNDADGDGENSTNDAADEEQQQ
ncbi:two-component system regulatory protein YycI [Alteribacillus sp. HJP-4]|uniref:two-component system regulatory protein YycI n=1 Tax=Alteribacillus sp. HJP-4 TaxID=2775394 RepID=UPI0035CCED6B